MDSTPIKRQAVIIIHGIGEQRPMDTMRSFTLNFKNFLGRKDITERDSKVWSKPDAISEIVGGPMTPSFGFGIKDIEVSRKSIPFYPAGHTDYWNKDSDAALAEIANALHLREAEPQPKANF